MSRPQGLLYDAERDLSAIAEFIPVKTGKGKGKCIYVALIFVVHVRRLGMDHTLLPAITPMPDFTS